MSVCKSYHEKGAPGFNLSYHSQRVQSLRSTAGLRMNHTWAWANGLSRLKSISPGKENMRIENRHFRSCSFGFSIKFLLHNLVEHTALGGIDLLWMLYDKYGIEVSYDFEWNTRFMDHFVYLGCSFRF
jgi:hypothetical protein